MKQVEFVPEVAVCEEPPTIAKQPSLQVDDVSFNSSSELSYTIKNLDMSSILKHRQGHHVSFKKSHKNKNNVPVRDLNIDDISIRSS